MCEPWLSDGARHVVEYGESLQWDHYDREYYWVTLLDVPWLAERWRGRKILTSVHRDTTIPAQTVWELALMAKCIEDLQGDYEREGGGTPEVP